MNKAKNLSLLGNREQGIDISRKEATGNRQQGEIIDNLWIIIDFIFDFYQMSNRKKVFLQI
ncbi:MAG: hypothetical protein F6K08_22500 [Okeania sp. SIO1H6]|uniref:Uncharacterized protein n=1 Tax=Okeania hirsuta TaxID=1458930 RepID=A0A3N6PIW6_9CYAN|nr:hypothetical protein [Okeania sp. SIO2G4]NEP07042.1 hypothetical protein [Okeania sp. SIO4D6]NET15405.1 hypothetical protein [Okeania sp. SIO1H6]RQH23158.1 hypothetical protein D4Z78_06435 [Okeania hirsuta]NEQ92740.1 hypothetical protein [Okeania sp. SIO2G4]RQH52766.1 hypothetical protein D5R40_04615 [Okeania hirsuta]